ncbi:MAG TPA: hypothetical protein VFQ45_05950 [Longimicrobium sp.]|nr:hypothetical protein [Longimicrobium sp.]
MYPVLQTVEISLRNRVHEVLSTHYSPGVPTGGPGALHSRSWLDAMPPILGPWEQDEVLKVKKRLGAEKKAVTPDRLIAGLSLGFWAALFTRRYEISPISSYTATAGRPTAFWPRHLRAVFPALPKRFATRSHAYTVLRNLADLRNQVFHHRPIWRLPLNALHVSATEVIGWISPDLRDLTVTMDRVPQVVAKGVAGFETDLAVFLAT